jgi:hypothetical protein
MGYALENVIKGMIISETWLNHPEKIEKVTNFEDLRVPKKDGTNDTVITMHLYGLFTVEGVHNRLFIGPEKQTLLELNEYVISAGRYPARRKGPASSHYKGKPIQSIGISIPIDYEMTSAIHLLYEKAIAELDRLNKQLTAEGKGPKSPYPG